MDISALLGISIGIIAILGTLLAESHSVSVIFQPTAALIVFGGTFGAGLINFPFNTIFQAFKEAFSFAENQKANTQVVVSQIIELAELAREQGALVLDSLSFAITDPFLQKSLQLSLDTNNGKVLENILNSEIEFEQENSMINPYVLESLGGYAPTFGIIGAVIGLIQVMSNLTSPSQLGYGISTAFVATIYGVGAANLIFLPLAGKLKIRIHDRVILKRIILEGVLSIHKCENPIITKEKIYSYLR